METVVLMPEQAVAPACTAAPACASCGTLLAGNYCHACGEKTLHRHDYSLKHFVEHAVDGITHFDLRVLRDLWEQLRRPGWLATEWLAGRRVRHAPPVQLFLVTNLLFYLASAKTHFSPFQTQLGSHLHGGFKGLAQHFLAAYFARHHTTFLALAPRFDELVHVYSKTLVFMFVPLLAGPLALLCWRQRRYFVEWLTITLYWFAGALMVFELIALVALAFYLLHIARQYFTSDALMGTTMFGLTTVYSFFFLRRVFPGGHALVRAGQAFGLVYCFLLALVYPYRLLLFLLTLWTV